MLAVNLSRYRELESCVANVRGKCVCHYCELIR